MVGEAAKLPNLVRLLSPDVHSACSPEFNSRRTVLDEAIPPNPRANPNPPPPAPGAVAQPPNNVQQGVPQQEPGLNPLGNRLGFANRIFAPPAQEANNAPPNPVAAQQPGAQQQGVAGHALPVVIQYEVRYQAPPGQTGGLPNFNFNQDQRQQPLTPVPQIPGFEIPHVAPQPRTSGQQASPSASVQLPEPTPTIPAVSGSQNARQSTSQSNLRRPSTSSPTDSSDSDSDEYFVESTTTVPPREAAREAALRRFGGAPLREPTATKTVEPTPHQASSSTSNGSDSTSVQQPAASHPSGAYPRLIPFYNLNSDNNIAARTQHPSLTVNHGSHLPSPVPPAFQQPQSQSYTPYEPGNRNASSFFPSQPQTPAPASDSRLPAQLTEQQLFAMDRLTREAIDERLRILERVSTTIHGCIDDLMRMRSALPIGSAFTATPSASSVSATDNQRAPSTLTVRPEEKRPQAGESSSTSEGAA